MKKILALCLTLTLALNLSAQTATPASVDKLLAASGAEKALNASFGYFDEMIEGMAAQMNITDAEKPMLAKYSTKITDILKAEMGWDKLKAPIADLYVNTFTEEEVKGIIAFYESPAGKAFADKMPEITQKSMEMSQNMMMTVMPKIQAVAQELGEELQKSRAK